MAGCAGMALAEAGGKRRSLSGGVEVREIAEAGHAKDGSARLALFAGDDGDAAGQRDGVVPEDDRGAVEQAREKHAFDAEVAEQEQVFRVRTDGGVEVVAALVAMGGKQAVKVFRDAPVDRVDAGSFIGGSMHPALRVIIHGLARPGGRKKIPAVPAGVNQRIGLVACVKLAQPGKNFGGFPDGFERERSGVARSAERGDIVGGVGNFCQAMAEKRCLAPALFGQRIARVVRLCVADDVDGHKKAPFVGAEIAALL